MVSILDVAHVGIMDLRGDALEFLKAASRVVQQHYVERSYKMFILNAPAWFSVLWKVRACGGVCVRDVILCLVEYGARASACLPPLLVSLTEWEVGRDVTFGSGSRRGKLLRVGTMHANGKCLE
jgi:hypothetical protein